MDIIRLDHTLPAVFAIRGYIESDIWCQDVVLEKGRIYLVEAASGTGKSSLCSYLYGYRKDYQGVITFDGRNVRKFSVADWTHLRQCHLSLMWQELRMFPELTALENILIKNRLTGFKRKEDIQLWFEELGIGDKQGIPLRFLSFGQQQRVAMIRALCQPFDFLFVDEPISHLDEENSRRMSDIMVEEAAKQGSSIVVTSIGKHMELCYDKILKL